jgi:ABC-type multidrug transport system fused ATPase/permease subunit
VNLILRNLLPQNGKILIDGHDISLIDDESLKQHISVVSQDTTLFNRSVFENIRYSKPDATIEDVIAIAKKANAHEFISNLEYGYYTNVGEKGMRLSGGQRQRVLIARAMLKNTPILILDEATSALDAESEKFVQDSLKILMEGKTVIAIAHKLNTLKTMNRIIVLQKGNIVEQGTHDELIKKENGVYKELWNIQREAILMDE